MDRLIPMNSLRLKTSRIDFNQLDPGDGSHFSRLWYQQHGSGRVYHIPWHTSSLSGPSPKALTLLGDDKFIDWRLMWLFFGGMPTGSEAFLESPGASGLQPCAWTRLKKAMYHTPLFGGACDEYRCFNKLGPVDGTHFGRP